MPKKCEPQCNDYALTMYIGPTLSLEFEYTDSQGDPVDLTGVVVSLGIKGIFDDIFRLASDDSPDVNGSSIVITDATAGKFQITLSGTQTELATASTGTWWVEFDGQLGVHDTIIAKDL